MESTENLIKQMESPEQNRANDPDGPDPSPLLPRLHAETQAQFDAVSGLLVVNVSQVAFLDAFMRWGRKEESDNQLISAINHETYHYFQTIAAGFPFRQMSAMVQTIAECLHRLDRRTWDPLIEGTKYTADIDAGKDVNEERQRLAALEELAEASGDPSLLNAMAPGLYPALEKMHAAARAPNAQGVSAMDLIEGSALIYQHALNSEREELEGKLDASWQDYDATYRRAYDFARAISGARTLDLILPSIALALRYANPSEAYPFFVSRLSSSRPGGEIDEARALAQHPPELPQAGRYFGTAMDVRRDESTYPYALYDSALNDLSTGAFGIDEIDLLARPVASEKVKKYKFGFVTQDGILFGGSREFIATRLVLGGVAFRSLSVPRYVREAKRRLLKQIGDESAQTAPELA